MSNSLSYNRKNNHNKCTKLVLFYDEHVYIDILWEKFYFVPFSIYNVKNIYNIQWTLDFILELVWNYNETIQISFLFVIMVIRYYNLLEMYFIRHIFFVKKGRFFKFRLTEFNKIKIQETYRDENEI